MAATDQPKKSAKIIWRTCMLCSTRLSELCYDTHTLCEACRGQVCTSDSFCKECESWSDDFRKLYLRHKNSLLMKRVSKKNRKEGRSKDKSPLQVDVAPPQVDDPPSLGVDDAASTASQESHVTSPVVMMPLNQDLIAANLTVEQLQTFQHVDNVVEVQLNERDKSRGSRHASPSLQHRLRRQLDDVHRQLDNAKEIVDLYHAQSRCLQIRPSTIWRSSRISMPSSASPWKSRWPPPPSIAMVHRLPLTESPLLVSKPLLRCVDLPVKTDLGPPRMTARVQETLMAVTIASVAVQTNATSSESLIATPLHTEGDPVPGSRILPDIWTSPASPLRLTIRHRETVFLRICHSRDDPPPGGHRRLGVPSRLLRGASPHGGPVRLLRGASPHGGPLRLLRGATPHGGPPRLFRDVLLHG